MALDLYTLKQIVREIIAARSDEINCDECLAQLDQFVELALVGKNPDEALPLVQEHLDRCHNCRQEFEALLQILHQSRLV